MYYYWVPLVLRVKILKSDIIVAVRNVAKQNIGLKTNALILDSYLLKTHL